MTTRPMVTSQPGTQPTIQPPGTHSSAGLRPLRRDAAENRERVLDAARALFAERGLDASVEDIAKVAGVGMGTLYRRFPTKQALIDELVGTLRLRMLDVARFCAEGDDGTGLETMLFQAGELQTSQPSCIQQLWNQSDAEAGALTELRNIIPVLLNTAQAAGRIRGDLASTDVTLAFWSIRSIIESTHSVVPNAWRRHVEVLLAGMRPTAGAAFDAPLAERALTRAEAQECMESAKS